MQVMQKLSSHLNLST